MDGDAGQGMGRAGGPRGLPQARGDGAGRQKRPYPARRAHQRGRNSGGTHGLQQQCRVLEAQGRADRLGAGGPGGCAAAGNRRRAERAAPARGACLRRFRSLAGGPGAAELDGPRAGKHEGADPHEQVRLHRGRSGDRARGTGKMEQALGGLIHPEMTGLIGLVFALGLRHGFDPDHLVAIEGMSRWSGLFFSLGHGAVVTLVGLGVALAAADLRAPRWLEQLGAWISIGVLLVLGIGNLLMTARTPSGTAVPLVGMRGRWLPDRLARASHPLVIASVGAAFALSFDTLSHALLFSLTGASMAGALFAAMLGIVFTLGMVLTDTLNGWWVARLVAGADRRAALVSRCVSVAIAFLCLALAAGGVAKYVLPALEEQAAAFGPVLSVGSILLISAVYALASRFTVLR